MTASETSESERKLDLATSWIDRADAFIITAGAGMGVDSGLPDFRGNEGFWKAYPPFRELGLSFYDLANPHWFERDPAQAWGFYGHRRNLYRQTEPHKGFAILLRWALSKPNGYFVFTSNVDGHFQRAGFPDDRIVECHGSIEFLQCSLPCVAGIWKAEADSIRIDQTTFRAEEPWPKCRLCDRVARPNVLMFGDTLWNYSRSEEQAARYKSWLREVGSAKVVVIEFGAGISVPTVRRHSEDLGVDLIRVNPREPQTPTGNIGLGMGAVEAIEAIDQRLTRHSGI